MTAPELSPLLRDLLYAQEHRLLDDDIGWAVRQVADAGVADEFVVGLVHDRVSKHQVEQAFQGPFSLPQLRRGDLIIGLEPGRREREVRLASRSLAEHVLLLGNTGSGKTTLVRFLALQVASLVKGLFLFDFRKKGEFVALVPLFHRLGIKTSIIRGRSGCFNPLEVPVHVDPLSWAARVAEMLEGTLRLPPRASKLLHATIIKLYQRFGTLNGGPAPTVFDLRETIAVDHEANSQAKLAAVDAFDPMLLSIGSTLCYRRGWPIGELARRKVIFEFSDLAEVDKDLLVNAILTAEFASRVAQPVPDRPLDLWVCCDEAARIASKSAHGSGMTELISLLRGAGAGVCLAVQQTSDLNPAILSNTSTKCIGRCGASSDYDLISAAMGLTAEQRRWMSLNLRPGLFVGQAGAGDWRHPFVIEVPWMNLAAAPTANSSGIADVDELHDLPCEPAPEFRNWRPGRQSIVVNAETSSTNDATVTATALSDADRGYLRAVINHPGIPSSGLPRIARIGPRRAQRIRERLVELGYLREHSVSTSIRGRTAIVLEPTDRALKALRGEEVVS